MWGTEYKSHFLSPWYLREGGRKSGIKPGKNGEKSTLRFGVNFSLSYPDLIGNKLYSFPQVKSFSPVPVIGEWSLTDTHMGPHLDPWVICYIFSPWPVWRGGYKGFAVYPARVNRTTLRADFCARVDSHHWAVSNDKEHLESQTDGAADLMSPWSISVVLCWIIPV